LSQAILQEASKLDSSAGEMAEYALPPGLPPTEIPKLVDNTVLERNVESGPEVSYAFEAPKTDLRTPKTSVVVTTAEIEPPTSRLDTNATRIKSSPYDDPLNFLILTELDTPTKLFALSLTQFNAIRPDYATAPYMSNFNLSTVFETLRDLCADAGIVWKRQEFYVVIFRSQLRGDADRERLGELDQMSHQEACASGGLLHYWFGIPDGEMRNLATCKSAPQNF